MFSTQHRLCTYKHAVYENTDVQTLDTGGHSLYLTQAHRAELLTRAYTQPPQASDHGVNFLTPSMSFGLDILLELLLDPYTCTDTHSEQCRLSQ